MLARRAAEETVLLNLDSEEYFGLEGVGSRLWDVLESGATFATILDTLGQEFEVERPVLETDLRRLLPGLLDNGLVARSRPSLVTPPRRFRTCSRPGPRRWPGSGSWPRSTAAEARGQDDT